MLTNCEVFDDKFIELFFSFEAQINDNKNQVIISVCDRRKDQQTLKESRLDIIKMRQSSDEKLINFNL